MWQAATLPEVLNIAATGYWPARERERREKMVLVCVACVCVRAFMRAGDNLVDRKSIETAGPPRGSVSLPQVSQYSHLLQLR